jgi:hypothetical protein
MPGGGCQAFQLPALMGRLLRRKDRQLKPILNS